MLRSEGAVTLRIGFFFGGISCPASEDRMPDLTKTAKDQSPVVLVNECLEIAAQHMRPHLDMWAETLSNYRSKGYADDADSVVVRLNYLRAIIERNVPRDASALLPQEPYIPIVARNKEYAPMARAKTKVHSGELRAAGFFPEFTDALKMAETYGTAFLEVFWDVWIENIFERELEYDEATGMVVGIGEHQYKEVRDGLGLRARGPWEVPVHPVGNTLDKKEWTAVKDVCHVKEIERLIDQGVYKLLKDKDSKALRTSPAEVSGIKDSWMTEWRRDTGPFNQGDTNAEVGVLVRLYSHDRVITTWNYNLVLKDNENENGNMRKSAKPLAQLKCNPHVGPDRFYGQGAWEIIQDLAIISDDLMSLYMEKQLQQVARWFISDPDFIDAENIKAEPGGIIELKNSPVQHGKTINDVLQVQDLPPVDDSLLNLVNFYRGEINDNRVGQTDISQGIAPSPKQTLGASTMLMDAAQTRLGFGARYLEQTFMHNFAYLVTKNCDRNMSIPQMVESGGITPDEAMMIVSPDPNNIPGGYDYEFEGSERVEHKKQKHEKLLEGFSIVGNTRVVQEGPALNVWVKKITEDTEVFNETDIEQMKLDWTPPPLPGQEPVIGEEIKSMGEDGAIMPPNQIPTPAQNAEGDM